MISNLDLISIGMRVILSDKSIAGIYKQYIGQVGTVERIEMGMCFVRFDIDNVILHLFPWRLDFATPENISKWQEHRRQAEDKRQREKHADKYL